MALPPPLTPRTALWPVEVDAAALVLVVAAAVAYGAGRRRLAAKGRRWPRTRTAAFAGGLAVILFATQSGLARYDTVLFSAHMGQHVLLGMVAPLLLAAGAPLTLALQAGRPATTLVLRRALRHPVTRAISHPLTAAVLFVGTPFLLYLTGLYEATLGHDVLHGWLHVHFLVVGFLWAAVVVGTDPHPVRLPHAGRLGMVAATLPAHAFLALALLSQTAVVAADWYASIGRTWGASALADQRTGAGLLWAAGELFGVVVGAVVLARWMGDSDREARRLDRRLDESLAATGAGPA